MIPINECLHGYLYELLSRNLTHGVYNAQSRGFVGIREKFGHKYLDTEFHRDIGPPCGTASPNKIVKQCPYEPVEFLDNDLSKNNTDLFNWLKSET